MNMIRDDLAWQLWRYGYQALPRARRRHEGQEAFRVRLLGRPALVVRGATAAREFYDAGLVRRHGAVPRAVSSLLFGRGAVHGLDGAEHLQRKAMFLRLLDDAAVTALKDLTHETLAKAIEVWPRDQEIDVFDALVQVYGRAALAWAGVDVRGPEATRISADLAAVVDGFGAQGRAYPRAWLARWRLDRWASRLVGKERSGRMAPNGSVLAVLSAHRGLDGKLLTPALAGVELLNVLRPTVAVAYLGAVAVVALDDHPEWRQELARPSAVAERTAFVQEVRRVFPFVPALAGKARRDAVIGGSRVSEGERIVLDVPGTNRDAAIWGDASRFDPGRFRGRSVGDFDMVPQGGGRPESGHRCPGEPLAIALLDTTVQVFAGLSWQLSDGRPVSTRRIPIRPDVRLRLRRA